jgi:UDP-glucose 4-epimerase
LVTGGFGFLGARIAEFLNRQGHYIVVGTRDSKIKSVNDKCNSKIVQISWNEQEKIDELCKGIDVVIHTAGMNASECVTDPASALEVNSVYTSRLVQSSIKNGVAQFLYISTVHVYSESLQGVISENTCPVNVHPYASSHKAAEDVVSYAHKQGLINGIVFRLSNGFGAPVHNTANCWKLFVNDLCMQSVRDRRLVLHSDGMQCRNFIPISEVCNIINHLVCKQLLNNEDNYSMPINVGGEQSYRILEMAKLIQDRSYQLFGYRPPISKLKNTNDSSRIMLDYKIDTLSSLGYTFQYSIEDEIELLLKYCHAQL